MNKRELTAGRSRSDGSVPSSFQVEGLRGGALESMQGAFRLTGARSGSARFEILAPGYLRLRTPRVLPDRRR